MSRHRNIRSMNYSDEYEGYDDVYGHSVEDDYYISPSDAAQFLYDREGSRGQQKISAFLKSDEGIAEEDETNLDKASDEDDVRLESCIEKIKNVIEVKIPKSELINIIKRNNFDVEACINCILSKNGNDTDKSEKKPLKEKEKPVSEDSNKPVTTLSSLVSDHLKNDTNFQVPKLFNTPNADLSSETKFSSLGDLTKNHLRNKILNKNSIFGNKPNQSKDKTSVINLNKSMRKVSLKENEINKTENDLNDGWCIDLSNALRGSTAVVSKVTVNDNTEIFVPQFINCDMVNNEKDKTNSYCTKDIKKIALLKNALDSKVSRFGKIVTKNFKFRIPFIDITYPRTNISKFHFKSLSPDDQILAHMRRK